MRVTLRTFLLLFSAGCPVVMTANPAVVHADPVQWEVGAGAAVRPDYEGSDDYQFVPLGSFRVQLDRESFVDFTGAKSSGRAAQLRLNLVSDFLVQFGPVAEFRWGRGDVHNDQVDAMKNIDSSFELGGFFGFDEQGWSGSATVVADVSETYKGVVVEIAAGYRRAFGDWFTAGTNLTLNWASDGYMSTFFSVNATDAARSGLDQYEAKDGFKDFGQQLFARVELPGIEGLGLMGIFSHYLMINDAADSPVVDDAGSKHQFFGGLMLVYAR